MAFTEHSDVFCAVHEKGLNKIIRHLMRQRPSWFNYGTALFVAKPELLCSRIEARSEVLQRENPLITQEQPLPIIGVHGALGVDFSFQVTDLVFDLYPGSLFDLPSELGALAPQRMAMRVEVCGAIICPEVDVVRRFADEYAQPISLAQLGKKPEEGRPDTQPAPPSPRPIPGGKPICFCLQGVAVGYFEHVGPKTRSHLAIRLQDLEIVDIAPAGLENALECFVATTIRVGILPRIRLALEALTLNLGKYAALSLSPTPLSSDVPNNPAIKKDQLMAFIDVEVTSP